MVKRALYGVLAVVLCLSLGSIAAPAGAEGPGSPGPGERRVVFVGNNWDGTADLLAPRSFERLARINVIPDYSERMAEIAANPYRLAYYLAIKTLIGEGNDQFVDDMYSSTDGRLVVISRPSFADVVAISLRTGRIVWRFPVEGVRSDHMAVSPNGRHVVVSASTGNVVHVLRVKDGKEVGRFGSGGSPHESISSTEASGSCTPPSARSTARSTSPACPTRWRGSGCCRSSTPRRSRSSAATTCARRSTPAV
jgi:hypothetical protein